MNFQEMIQREDFPNALLETIKRYYREKERINVTITDKPIINSTELLLFYRPLFLSSKHVPKGGKRLLYGEYNIRGSIIKYVVAKIGIFATTHLSKFFSKKRFFISPKVDSNGIFICPCNRSVRFYNFESDTVDCFLKEGFSSEYMDRQVDFRTECNYEFVPQVLDRGFKWYSEKIMHGHALARVRNQAEHDEAIQMAIGCLKVLANDTLRIVPSAEYLLYLKKTFTDILTKLYDDEYTTVFDSINIFAQMLEKQINRNPLEIPTCTSHGDLQEGNIWLKDDGNILIYDWETVDTRSVWYDPLTLYMGMHNKPYSDEIYSFLKQDKRYLAFDPRKDYTVDDLASILHIILYEDLIFQLTEATQLAGEYKQIRAASIMEAIKKSSYWRNR